MNKIQEIHASKMYGLVIETGCGVSIASKLYSEPHTSSTLFNSSQPYAKEKQEELYGESKRSVSKEWVEKALNAELMNSANNNNINFILITSWQLSDNDPNKYCHGWFAFANRLTGNKYYLHYSFHKNSMMDRIASFDAIGNIGIDIIHSQINGNMDELKNSNTSAILDMAYIDRYDDSVEAFVEDVYYDLVIDTLENRDEDYLLVFTKGGMMRIEDLARMSNEFIIQKGSFNPIHEGHMSLMHIGEKMFPKAVSAFLISTNRYDKPHIGVDELHDRIKNITNYNYPLIICKEKYFYGTSDLLLNWVGAKQFYYPIGMDTINRIYQTDFDETNRVEEMTKTYIKDKVSKYVNNFKFLVFKRKNVEQRNETHYFDDMVTYVSENDYLDNGVSSSNIRTGQQKNLINEHG